jgi:hypothetical protein
VVPAGGYADLVGDDLVDEAVFVGDPAGPVSLEAMLERLGFADPFVAVALDNSNQGVDPLQDLAVLGRTLPRWDSGDHLHPNDLGYRHMADSIDLALFG